MYFKNRIILPLGFLMLLSCTESSTGRTGVAKFLDCFPMFSSCTGLPTESPTGRTSVVKILDQAVTPRDVTVRPGDEVRILNERADSAWVYFERDRPKELLCQRGFSYFWGIEEVAEVKPGESVSVCFSTEGAYGYWVQSQPTIQGGARLGELDMPTSLPAAVIVEVGRD